MSMFDLAALEAAPLVTEPFSYLVVPGFLVPDACRVVNENYPKIDLPGSFPTSELEVTPPFAAFLAELEGPELRAALARKFGVDLTGRPTMVTVRCRAQAKDGRIHTDTKSKILTILLYMNDRWDAPGGRLRLLRSPDSLDNPIAEVPPDQGTLLAFKVSENSWHGHHPFVGQRRVLQLNYVTDAEVVRSEQARHRLSAKVKKLFRFAS